MALMGTEMSYYKAKIYCYMKIVTFLCYLTTLWNGNEILRQKYSKIILSHGQFFHNKTDMD